MTNWRAEKKKSVDTWSKKRKEGEMEGEKKQNKTTKNETKQRKTKLFDNLHEEVEDLGFPNCCLNVLFLKRPPLVLFRIAPWSVRRDVPSLVHSCWHTLKTKITHFVVVASWFNCQGVDDGDALTPLKLQSVLQYCIPTQRWKRSTLLVLLACFSPRVLNVSGWVSVHKYAVGSRKISPPQASIYWGLPHRTLANDCLYRGVEKIIREEREKTIARQLATLNLSTVSMETPARTRHESTESGWSYTWILIIIFSFTWVWARE